MARIIAIANQKGGVGKSSIATNLPVFLAALGKHVLLVDMDAQANATLSLGIAPNNLPLSIYHALMGQVSPSAIIRKSPFFGYDIMPASPDLAGATVELVNADGREFKLSQVLDSIKESYDYIFIDSPPSLGLLTLNALCAADEILVPVQCEYLALEGLGQLIHTVSLIQNNLKSNLQVTGAILTMYSKTNRISREIAKEVRSTFPGYVFETVIPRQVVLAEAPMYGKTIMQYAPTSRASQAFKALAEELINLNNLKTQPNT